MMGRITTPVFATVAIFAAAAAYCALALHPNTNRADGQEAITSDANDVSAQSSEISMANTPAEIHEVDAAGNSGLEWSRPSTTPTWMSRGKAANDRLERSARVLEHVLAEKYPPQPLNVTLREIAKHCKTTIAFKRRELEAFGIDIEIPMELNLEGEYTVREALSALLEPLGCAWAVTESGLAITSKADQRAALIRHYDLSHVLPGPAHVDSLMNVLMQTCEPDSWLSNGGSNTMLPIGPALVVYAPEPLHHQIEIQLYLLSKIDQAKLLATPGPHANATDFGMGGGVGFGMGGGMGGGMGMGGGGMGGGGMGSGGMGSGGMGSGGMGSGQPRQSRPSGGY